MGPLNLTIASGVAHQAQAQVGAAGVKGFPEYFEVALSKTVNSCSRTQCGRHLIKVTF